MRVERTFIAEARKSGEAESVSVFPLFSVSAINLEHYTNVPKQLDYSGKDSW
jgi:hypothetical protein